MFEGVVSVESGRYFVLFEGVSDERSKGWYIVDSSKIRGFIGTRTVKVNGHHPFIHFINNGYNGILVVAITKCDLKDNAFFPFS
jgi:hypothetical protein